MKIWKENLYRYKGNKHWDKRLIVLQGGGHDIYTPWQIPIRICITEKSLHPFIRYFLTTNKVLEIYLWLSSTKWLRNSCRYSLHNIYNIGSHRKVLLSSIEVEKFVLTEILSNNLQMCRKPYRTSFPILR